jgi:hypothetical protein
MDKLEQEMENGMLFSESLRLEDVKTRQTVKEQLREMIPMFSEGQSYC